MNIEVLKRVLKEAQRDERHNNNAETRYWCSQYKAIAEKAIAALAAQQEPVLQDIEQYRLQMAGISTAAIGYWKESDGIHPDYDTIALRDVAKLYAKYDELYRAQRTWVGLTDEEIINVMPDDDTPMSLGEAFSVFAEAIEAKLKEKNT